MRTFRIYCGLDTNGHVLTDDKGHYLAMTPDYPLSPAHCQTTARVVAERLALQFFPHGHTLIEAQGRWQSEKVAVTEPTLIIEVITDDPSKVWELAGAYKEQTNQESVMVTSTTIEADFV